MSKEYRAVIVEDEPEARENLAGFLEDYCPQIKVVAEAESAITGVKEIRNHKPDLVFLDVEMPGGNGFDMLSMFEGEEVNFEVIFTTAYGHYAIRAIKFSALDYILKPLDIEELQEAVARFEQKYEKKNGRKERISTLIHNLGQPEISDVKLVVPEMSGFTVLDVDDIIFFMSDGSYTDIVMKGNQKITSSKSLRYFEDVVEKQKSFYRVSRSYIINLQHIVKYSAGEGGTILLAEGHEVDVPRRKKQEFLDIFKRLG